MSKSDEPGFNTTNVIRGLMIIAVFASTLYLGLQKQPAEMGIMAAMGLVLLAFINLDKFTSFKGAGFEAQMREMQAVTEEAKASLVQLQKMSEVTSEVMTMVVARHGRWGGSFSAEEAADYRERMTSALIAMDIPVARANEITSSMTKYGKFDLLASIEAAVSYRSGHAHHVEGQRAWAGFRSTHHDPSPKQLRRFLKENSLDTEDAVALVDRLESYEKHMIEKYGSYPTPNPNE